jgi:hypothetical protein
MILTYKFAMAAAQDAGNRAMRAAGRHAWARADFDVACATFDRLWDAKANAPRSTQRKAA